MRNIPDGCDPVNPKVAFFDFASCEGCQLQVANLEEEILKLVSECDIVSFREIMKESSDNYDIAFIEGSIIRPMDEERLKRIRSNAKVLVALGDCACNGGVNKLNTGYSRDELVSEVYDNDMRSNPLFETTGAKAIDEVVDVDLHIYGCPIQGQRILYYIERASDGTLKKSMETEYPLLSREKGVDERHSVIYDPKKCILCRNCHVICNDVLDVHAIGVSARGNVSVISTPFDAGLKDSGCISCGQCVMNCPVGALYERSDVDKAIELMRDASNFVVFVIDPIAVSSAVNALDTAGAGMTSVMSRVIKAMRELGASRVVDFTEFAHLSYAAQGEYIKDGHSMSFASWCPGTYEYIRRFYPQYRRNLRPELSPESLLVNVLKKKYAKENLKIVLLSQCSVYKDRRNFDAVLTARELPRLLSAGDIRIDLYAVEEQDSSGTFDVELSKKRAFVAGVRSDYTYSQSILDAAYMSKFGVLDVPLNLSAVEDHVYELAFDSDEVFFSALLIEDISKAEKYLTKGVEKYNLVELYPCFYGCLTGGGQMFARDMNEIEARLERLKEYKGTLPKGDLVSQMLASYKKAKEVMGWM